MPGGDVRSALVVSCGVRRPSPHAEASEAELFELVGLLRDPTIGGFEVSVLLEPTGAELRQELVRFLADRAPHDTVVVHLAGRFVVDQSGEHHLCCHDDAPTAASLHDGLPLAVLEQELRRCRSERIVVLLDCRADKPANTAGQAPSEPCRALGERLRGPGRIVQHAPTALVIDALRGPGDDREPAGPAELAAVLRMKPEGPTLPAPTGGRTRRPRAAVVVAIPATSFGVLGVGGAVGGTLSAAAAAFITWSALPAVTRAWRTLPPDDCVLGEGVPFYRLYMLRRSQRSKDYFRHH